jgi:nucleoside-diphosphate-sugar epimerase
MNSPFYQTPSAQNFLLAMQSVLSPQHRILINGANGWLGSNISETLFKLYNSQFERNVLLTGSSNSTLQIQSGEHLQVKKWSRALVSDFAPTHVIQLAFKTRDHVSEMSIDDYLKVNEEIIDRAIWMLSLPSLRGFLHTSSGAALGVNADDKYLDPYGYLKKFEEHVYSDTCKFQGKECLGLRVWSTTGRYIKTGGVFAIESFISQAISSKSIHVNSPGEVFRSYADANEIMLAGLLGILTNNQGMFNSGGTEVEIGELARQIAAMSPTNEVGVVRSSAPFSIPNIYRSIEPSIEQILKNHDLQYSNLQEQIKNTMEYLIWQKKANGLASGGI